MTNTGEPRIEAQEIDLEDLGIRMHVAGSKMIRDASKMPTADRKAKFFRSTGDYLVATAHYVYAQAEVGVMDPDEVARLVDVQVGMADVYLEHGPSDLRAKAEEVLT